MAVIESPIIYITGNNKFNKILYIEKIKLISESHLICMGTILQVILSIVLTFLIIEAYPIFLALILISIPLILFSSPIIILAIIFPNFLLLWIALEIGLLIWLFS